MFGQAKFSFRTFPSRSSCHLRAFAAVSGQGDRQSAGRESRLCPVSAYEEWIRLAGIGEGPVFRGINRWGQLSDQSLKPNSVSALLRRVFEESGISMHASISSHSLRRGFASWANRNGWDAKALMENVGWKDIQSAIRYIDVPDHFSRRLIEQSLAESPQDQRD
ncbi:tyrosine-type recombinase/integrase [Microbulbifer rhizosphaerae]|uniref:tyrosine-type recombinase/integrase n=1 Tax=Microbulbifer rhizosphaerae TaxID=1562603 RepID=UPI003CCE018E